ncbi:pyruvate dehydrogenase E1 alpha subunit, partial [Candidatus Thiomargarita nelsonii]
WGEGSVYETLNMSKLWELPLVVIVENNNISQTTPSLLNRAGTIEGRVRGFNIDYISIISRDVWECRELTAPSIEKVRQKSGPLVIEFETDRLGSHSKGDDTRPLELIKKIKKNDWFWALQEKYPEQFHRILPMVQERIEKLAQEISSRPFSSWSGYEN